MILTSQLSIRMRLLLAILVPVVLTAMVSGAVSVSEIRSNGDAELQRLQQGLLDSIKVEANKRDMPYQSLIKVWLAKQVQENRQY